MNTMDGSNNAKGQYLLQRSVLRWLAAQDAPSGVAINVPARKARAKVDVAALWCPQPSTSISKRRSAFRLPAMHSAVFLCHSSRDECWPECSNAQAICNEREALLAKIEAQQDAIRKNEPHLRDGNVLFAEFASWDYQRSTNALYHQLCERIDALDRMLYQGTRIERLAKAQVANLFYLVVPQHCVMPHEVHDGWGLLWLDNKGTLDLVKTPPAHDTSPGADYLFLQYMLAGGTQLVNELYDLDSNKKTQYAIGVLKKQAACRRQPTTTAAPEPRKDPTP